MEFTPDKSGDTGINYASFNQNSTYFTLATKNGYVVYSIGAKIEKYFHDEGGCGRSVVEMFEDSALIGLIGTGEDFSVSQRKVFLYNMQSDENICSFSYPTAVIALKFSKERLVFIMENEIHIHDSEMLAEKPFILPTYNNPKGICALSSRGQLISYPAPNPDKKDKGTVAIFDCKNQESYCHPITGHSEPIAAIALNKNGDLLATASTRGTNIRVFKLPERKEEFVFRRGSYAAEITNISFSDDSSLLCVSSDKPTVHIFPLVKPDPKNESVFSSYIPTVLSTVWDDHIKIRLPNDVTKSIATISNNNRFVYVISQEGNFYTYDLEAARAGSCETPTIKQSLTISNFKTESVLYL